MASIVSMHIVPQKGCSPLYAASQEGHTDIVNILLKSGADVHQTTEVCHYNNHYLPSDSTHSLHVFVSVICHFHESLPAFPETLQLAMWDSLTRCASSYWTKNIAVLVKTTKQPQAIHCNRDIFVHITG